jgi:hypothetical protein
MRNPTSLSHIAGEIHASPKNFLLVKAMKCLMARFSLNVYSDNYGQPRQSDSRCSECYVEDVDETGL